MSNVLSYSANLVLGSYRLGLFLFPGGEPSLGRWVFLNGGRTDLKLQLINLCGGGSSNHSHAGIRLSGGTSLYRLSSTQQDPHDGIEATSLLGTRVDACSSLNGFTVPKYLQPQWRRGAAEAARVVSESLRDGLRWFGVNKIDDLAIQYTRPAQYVSNIACNAIGQALGMRRGPVTPATLEDYGWDERPLYNIRRGHISDWFRKKPGNLLIVSEDGEGIALWRWKRASGVTVQADDDEYSAFANSFSRRVVAALQKSTELRYPKKADAMRLDLKREHVTSIFWDTRRSMKTRNIWGVSHFHIGEGESVNA